MGAGLIAAQANAVADSCAGSWVQLHTANPGAAGASNIVTGVTARQSITYGAAAGGVKQATSQPVWTAFPTQQIVAYISEWDAQTGGACKRTVQLASAVTVAAAGSFTLISSQISVGPVAS
jgi:hypothetical protein